MQANTLSFGLHSASLLHAFCMRRNDVILSPMPAHTSATRGWHHGQLGEKAEMQRAAEVVHAG